MLSQNFKKIYPKEEFIDFLKSYSSYNEKYLIFSKAAFKKMKIDKKCQPFFDKLKKYYHESKNFYVNRIPIYKHFVTVIKQICKINSIPYTSKISYSKSTYELSYYIYYNFKLIK